MCIASNKRNLDEAFEKKKKIYWKEDNSFVFVDNNVTAKINSSAEAEDGLGSTKRNHQIIPPFFPFGKLDGISAEYLNCQKSCCRILDAVQLLDFGLDIILKVLWLFVYNSCLSINVYGASNFSL